MLVNIFFWLPVNNSILIYSLFHCIVRRNWDALDREAILQGKRLWKVHSSRCSDKNKEEDEAQGRDSGHSRIRQYGWTYRINASPNPRPCPNTACIEFSELIIPLNKIVCMFQDWMTERDTDWSISFQYVVVNTYN